MADDDPDELGRLLLTHRDWDSYWTWGDKPGKEHRAADQVLRLAGFQVDGLVSRPEGQDPPDCEALVDGRWSGVEVTELVHRKTLERSLKAQRERREGKEPARAEAYFLWDRTDLLTEIQTLISAKDCQALRSAGGPYERYRLVIVTDEFMLDRDRVTSFLAGAVFSATRITDVLLGLSYHPAEEGDGTCPVFRLELEAARGSLTGPK